MPTLAQLRRKKFLTQKQLAELLGVTDTLVSSWERGVYQPRLSNLKKLCEILDVSLDDIEFLSKPPDDSVGGLGDSTNSGYIR